MPSNPARILLGVSAGIAAYKAVEFTRLAIKAGHTVRAVQTPASEHFVGKATFEGITGAPVLIDQFERDPAGGVFPGQERPAHDPISHLALAENCDIYVIAPATANTIAKLAGGYADNMVTALALSCRKPVVVAPAMNNEMYENAATQDNVATLRDRGFVIADPGVGELASKGEYGVGRLVEPPDVLALVERILNESAGIGGFAPRSLDGLKVLVTAGGTREPIDAVRYVGNRSSGKMGNAVAEEAARRGAEVTVIAANVSLAHVEGVEYVDVQTAAQMHDAAAARFPACDVLVMAAAVADFRPSHAATDKIKKAGKTAIDLRLEPTEDILAGLAAKRGTKQLLVGFAAETGDALVAEARRKLEQKDLDLVVANDVGDPGIGFEADQNAVTLVGPGDQTRQVARASKQVIAQAIVDRIEALLQTAASIDRAGKSTHE